VPRVPVILHCLQDLSEVSCKFIYCIQHFIRNAHCQKYGVVKCKTLGTCIILHFDYAQFSLFYALKWSSLSQ
jgi:hypothetical protein